MELFSYLFGSVLTIDPRDLWLVVGLTVVVIGFVGLFFSELAQSSFDSDLARPAVFLWAGSTWSWPCLQARR